MVALIWSTWLWEGTDSWFGYLGICSKESFELALAAHTANPREYEPEHEPWTHASVALTTLRRLDPDRFQALRAVLGPSWHRLFDRIDAMARQMVRHGNARLHPELEKLNQLLAPPPDRDHTPKD